MEQHISSVRMAEGVERAMRHWEKRGELQERKETASPGPTAVTIAISREAGARGAETAQLLGQRLHWPVYDHELIEKIARELGLRTNLIESIDERHTSWLRECIEACASARVVSGDLYVRHLVETLMSLATHGECVIVGRGAALILPRETTLSVRMVAPLARRIANTEQRLKVSRARAEEWVEKTDRERSRFLRDYFQQDVNDLTAYDLVLNSGRFSVDECVDLILPALRCRQDQATRLAERRAQADAPAGRIVAAT